ncbi:MAG: hypothetical protein JSR86_14350 [Proteobacteria bacterium]|nr:hypothetical protein [Pseudomonadota bacterium]
MPDTRTTPQRAWLAFIAPISIALVVAAMVAASVLTRRPAPPVATPAATATVASQPTRAAGSSTLGRQDLITAADAAAVAYAANLPSPSVNEALVGRNFKVRIPFGCDGPQIGPGPAQAHYEVGEAGLSDRLIAQPSEWSSLPVLQGTADAARAESVEGFWIPRPWTYLDTCPPRRDNPLPATPTPPASQTLGLAQFFTKGSARAARHAGAPYQAVWTPKANAKAESAAQSFDLVLEGQITGYADGRAVRCWSESVDHRPICIFAVSLSRVAFEDAAGHRVAEWRQ